MNNIQHEITIDVLSPRKNIIHVVQDDSLRVIRLNLLNNGLPFDIRDVAQESGIIGIVAFQKPDGHHGEYDTLSDGVTPAVEEYRTIPQSPIIATSWTVHIEGQVTACAGFTQVTVKFYKEDGQLIQTFPIVLDVQKAASSITEPSEDYYNVLSIADALEAARNVGDDVTALKSGRVVRIYKLYRPINVTSWFANMANIFPSGGVKIGDYVITDDLAICTVTAVHNNGVQLQYVQDFYIPGGGGGEGQPGRDAVIWYADAGPYSSASGKIIPLVDLAGPSGAVAAAGDMIVCGFDNYAYFVDHIDDAVAVLLADRVYTKGDTGATGPQGEPGTDGTNGVDGADGRDAVIWYTTNAPAGRLPGETGGYIAISALSGPVGAVPAAGQMVVSNSDSGQYAYFIEGLNEYDQVILALQRVGIKGADGTDGQDGTDGATFTPSVSSAGVISWTNDGGKQNPASVDLVAAVLDALVDADEEEY